MTLHSLKEFKVLVEGLDHPECVAWSPAGFLYAGGEAGQIYRVNLDGSFAELTSTGGFILGVCVDGNDNVYACDAKQQKVVRIDPHGKAEVYSDGSPDRKMSVPNFAVFDHAGNLYVSDSGGWHENNGCIFRIAPTGETCVINAQAMAFPNGMALNPSGEELYVVLSNLPGVVKLPIRRDGSCSAPQLVIEMPGTVPDGLAFDIEGGLYISCYTPDAIYRFSPTGELQLVAEDAERTTISAPTNIAFAGPQLSTFVVANFGVWHLTQLKMAVPGLPLQYPDLRDCRIR